jgi:GWxTD domain-containing protein
MICSSAARPVDIVLAIAIAFVVFAVGRTDAQERAPEHSPYEKWVNEDVAYIITPEERSAFNRLATDEERAQFIEQFWTRRDPTPGTVENEFKEEHYRRIAYANERYASDIPGWKTDRGRFYITYGPPNEIEAHPQQSYEIWRWKHVDRLGDNIELRFEGVDYHLRK